MRYLKTFAVALPFLFAGMGALLFATMMIKPESEPERLPFAYVTLELEERESSYDLHVMDALSGKIMFEMDTLHDDCSSSVSPDGRWLLYFGGTDFPDGYQTYFVDLQTGETTPLVSATSSSSFPNFIRWEGDTVSYLLSKKSSDEDSKYFSYDTATGNLEIILTVHSPAVLASIRWIDDELVYVIEEDDQLIIHRGDGNSETFLLPEGSNRGLSISFDARYISLELRNTSSKWEMQIFDTQTSELITGINTNWLSWKADTNEVGYVDANDNIYLYNVSTQEMKVFETPVGDIGNLSSLRWSPYGRYAAYSHYTAAEFTDLYVLDTISGESHLIARGISIWVYGIKWLSDTKLVYIYNSNYNQTYDEYLFANADLWLYDVATGETRQLTNTPELNEVLGCGFG